MGGLALIIRNNSSLESYKSKFVYIRGKPVSESRVDIYKRSFFLRGEKGVEAKISPPLES